MSIHLTGLEPGMLGAATLVVGDPGRVDLLAELLDGVRTVTDNRELRLVTGTFEGTTVSVCSTGMGVGSTEICVTELIENGAAQIIRCGGCGAWQDGIAIGDIIVNNAMARTSGLMSSYVPDAYPAAADPALLVRIDQAAKRHGLTTHRGIGLTSETYYIGQGRAPRIPGHLDVSEVMPYYTARNVLNCEMETAVLYILGALYGIPVANALVVHVTRSNDAWADQPRYRERHLASARAVLEAALRTAD